MLELLLVPIGLALVLGLLDLYLEARTAARLHKSIATRARNLRRHHEH
jgi:hypothetical protein